ncbi:MAG: phytoene desaturase [Planctomycetes bacterium]|nr:phytoene desaturase [Planctomycetota bacterium]
MAASRAEVSIIGAGPGGLAAALLLAKAGARVRLFESQSRVGGRTAAIEQDGYRFDLGPTFFLYPRILSEIFTAIGRNLETEIPLTKLDPQYRLVFGAGGHLDATPNLTEMDRQIAALSPQDAGAFQRFMNENRVKLAKLRPLLESPFCSMADLLSPAVFESLPWLRVWRSLGGELQRFFTDPRLVVAFTFQSKYLGMSPFRCPSVFSILSFLEYEYGIFHPQGGCSAIMERMAEIATEMGVEIHLNEPVEQIEFRGKRAVGVQTRQDRYACDSLVVNADFSHAMTRLVPDHLRRRWTDRKLEQKRYSCSTFMLYLGIEGRYDDLPHHTIYIAKDYQQNLADIETRQVLSVDPSFYVQNACVTDPGLAPQGCSTLYVLVPVPHRNDHLDWSVERDRFRQVALRQLHKIGLHDVERRIRVEKMVTPHDWEQQYAVHKGATFNLAHNLGQMLHRRPNNRFEDLDGVYLVGGGTHPGSGLPVIFESARISTKLLAHDLGLPDPTGVPANHQTLTALPS